MSTTVRYRLNKASETQIAEHLLHCDAEFVPRLSGRVEIIDYARKITKNATRFEAWSGSILIGLIAAYCNDLKSRTVYITSVSVLRKWMGKGIAVKLMKQSIEHAEALSMLQMTLEVASGNIPAIRLYEKAGFVAGKVSASSLSMDLLLARGEEHERQA